MMLALTGVKLISKFVPIVANDTVDSINGVIGCRKTTFRVMLLPMVLLANNDCAIDRTGSRVIPTGSMIKVSRPFYWILLKEANLYTRRLHDCTDGMSQM